MAPKVGPLLPVSDRRGGDDGALLFKGSAMTMRGAFAALSYMTCAESSVISCKSSWQKLATMESVRRVNVPMYTTLRRTTVVFTMIVEYLLTRQKYTRHVVGRL
ncbi:UDP-N-acetylglucosamine transporter UGNT1-like [Musa acuminata AAA Group]|uniref:UDP-N-acetylglucosamine transporter UGNT1-like n=1 Tax=Musa acuminata AAA Group TaxID=214697 RepID=UPI0031DF903D